MSLTYVDLTESAVTGTVDADPVKALRAADRDGLLHYLGFVSGGRYEVEVLGQVRELPEDQVPGTVLRLRAVAGLSAAGVDARLVEMADDGTHVVEVDGHRVTLADKVVVDWCAGYSAARRGEGQEHAGEDRIAQIAELFERPSRDDQCRMVVLGLMHGREGQRVSAEELAERVGKSKKTVVDALGFGSYLAPDVAEKMIEAFGLRWSVSAGRGVCERAEGGAVGPPLPQMPGLAMLRRLASASAAGWLRYVDEPSPNKARWKPERDRRFHLAVGQQGYVVGTEGLHAWLDGIAAYHAGRE